MENWAETDRCGLAQDNNRPASDAIEVTQTEAFETITGHRGFVIRLGTAKGRLENAEPNFTGKKVSLPQPIWFGTKPFEPVCLRQQCSTAIAQTSGPEPYPIETTRRLLQA